MPQQGPQTAFLQTEADICIYGGAAGGGKSHAILMEPLRHYDNPKFKAVIFRRTNPMIAMPGGLWDEAAKMYGAFNTRPVESPRYRHTFPSGMTVTFSHMQLERDKLNWQGSQFSLVCFDELTHFTESQFFYMISRLRSDAGVPGYVRASTNPDADSWVREFIGWWIDDEGFPDPEKAGKTRYMCRLQDDIVWADSREELIEEHGAPENGIKSVTFIPATVQDNKALLNNDPAYLSNLQILPRMERERLLRGNWDIRQGGEILEGAWFEVVNTWPAEAKMVRFWDLAGTDPDKPKSRRKRNSSGDPDYTAGVLMGEHEGVFYIADVRRFRKSPKDVEDRIKHTADIDGKYMPVRMWQDPAQAGVAQIDNYGRKVLLGYDFQGVHIPGRLDQMIGPFASAAERGCIKLVRGKWNRDFVNEMEGLWEGHDDQLAAALGAFNHLTVDYDPVTVHYAGEKGPEHDPHQELIKNVNDDSFWD